MDDALAADHVGRRQPQAVILGEGEGRQLAFFGGVQTMTIKLTGKDSNGQLGIYENTLDPRTRGASPHFHKALVEAFYVLEGELTLYAKDRTVFLAKGGMVAVPPNTIHAFANSSDAPVKFLIIFSNDPEPGRETYFEQVSLYSNSTPMPAPEVWQQLDLAFDTYRTPDIQFTLDRPSS